MSSLRIGSGSTPSGATNWQPYLDGTGTQGIVVDVITSAAGFKNTPTYVASLAGVSEHWETVGGSSIYNPSPTKFQIFVRYIQDRRDLTPEKANQLKWVVNWIGIET